MHPFITRYRKDPKNSVLLFCEAALAFSPDLIKDIWKYFPEGTAANYVSKIRVLREFIVDNGLETCSASDLVEILKESQNIRAAREISRRNLSGHYAEARSTKKEAPDIGDLMQQLEVLDADTLIKIRDRITSLLVRK
jgi:hypothetical protein